MNLNNRIGRLFFSQKPMKDWTSNYYSFVIRFFDFIKKRWSKSYPDLEQLFQASVDEKRTHEIDELGYDIYKNALNNLSPTKGRKRTVFLPQM